AASWNGTISRRPATSFRLTQAALRRQKPQSPSMRTRDFTLRLAAEALHHCVDDDLVAGALHRSARAVGTGVAQRAGVGRARDGEVARELLQLVDLDGR